MTSARMMTQARRYRHDPMNPEGENLDMNSEGEMYEQESQQEMEQALTQCPQRDSLRLRKHRQHQQPTT